MDCLRVLLSPQSLSATLRYGAQRLLERIQGGGDVVDEVDSRGIPFNASAFSMRIGRSDVACDGTSCRQESGRCGRRCDPGLLPVASFLLQYTLSVLIPAPTRASSETITVAYLDWLFVPFNFVVVWTIDWRRGGTFLPIVFVSIIANIVAHAIWQYYGIDGGYMITRGTETVLPAGWVHFGFSIIETTLILAFVFIPRPRRPFTRIATVLALAFFLAAGVSGYSSITGLSPRMSLWSGAEWLLWPFTGQASALRRGRADDWKTLQGKELRHAPCSAAGQE